jgi:hypothetical protein
VDRNKIAGKVIFVFYIPQRLQWAFRSTLNYKIRSILETSTGIKQLLNVVLIVIIIYSFNTRISEIVIERFLSGKGMLPDWLYNLTQSGREQNKILKQMHDFTSKVFTEHRELFLVL